MRLSLSLVPFITASLVAGGPLASPQRTTYPAPAAPDRTAAYDPNPAEEENLILKRSAPSAATAAAASLSFRNIVSPRTVDNSAIANAGDFFIDRNSCNSTQKTEISRALSNCQHVAWFAAWFVGQAGKAVKEITEAFGAADVGARELLLDDYLTMREFCREHDRDARRPAGQDGSVSQRRTISCLAQAECEVDGVDGFDYVIRRSESGDVGICPVSFGRTIDPYSTTCSRLGLANVFLRHGAALVSTAYDNDSGSTAWNAEAFIKLATGFNLNCFANISATEAARL